ncbi:NAD(P)-binding protein [Hypoxylon sp. NC1633]|nr:NAD(P)-binding protein [Hypoxylon sp. NC1633]
MSRTVLVTGATGTQGGAVVDALLKSNVDFEILALTRTPQSASAQKLQQKSPKIKIVPGDLNDPESIFSKAKELTKNPIWGVFSVQLAIGDGANPKIEEAQGKALVDASIKHGVKHMVYSSVDRHGSKSDTEPTEIPHFMSKHHVEQYLFQKTRDGAMDWTVLRPVAFFENLVPDSFMSKFFTTSYKIYLKKHQKLQLIAASDIGFFAALALANPAEYKGQKISLAGDELTFDEYAAVFKEKTGTTLPTTFGFVAAFIGWMVKEFGYMFKWFSDVGYDADIAALRKINPELKDFRAWLDESKFKTIS